MDIQALHSCFSATVATNADTRVRAELELRAAEKSPGFINGCMDILVEPQVDKQVKHAAAIYLKNKVTKYWKPIDETSVLKVRDDEKPQFRERVIPALMDTDKFVRPHIEAILQTLVSKDLNNWPQLVENTMKLLQSDDINAVGAGLTCLKEICRFYRWTSNEARKGLDEVINMTFAGVLNIGNQLVEQTNSDKESSDAAGEMLRNVMKIYKMATYHILPDQLQQYDSIVGWGTLFLRVVKMNFPQSVLDLDEWERPQEPWVKCKKWAYANLFRLLFRYANSETQNDKDSKYYQFANLYINHFVPEILKSYFEQIQAWVEKKVYISGACMYNMLSFFDRCVTNKSTWEMIKPHIDTLVSHVIFPLLIPTDDDLDMIEEDPEEYIHRRIDFFEETPTADVAATNFLLTLVRKRRSTTFTPMLQFVQGVLDRQMQNPEDLQLCREKEAALRMMSTVDFVVTSKKSPIADKMEGFLAQYVFPDFNSKYHFLRARACEFLNRYASIEFQDVNNISFAYQSVVKCMNDQYLPVQVEAALALQPMIAHDSVKNALSTKIPEVMQHLLDLGKRIDNDAISGIMEEFVEVFAEQLAPFAVQLAEQMSDQFMKINSSLIEKQNVPVDEIDFDDMSGDDKTMAASGILTTLSSLLLALEHGPELVGELEKVLMPIFVSVLENDMSEFYTEVFGLIENCTFCQKRVSPDMWNILRLMQRAFDGLGLDYLDDMMPCLDEFIQFGSEDMRNNPELSHIMYSIINLVMNDDTNRMGARDRVLVAALSQKMLIALKGTIDDYVPNLLEMALTRLANDGKLLKNVSYNVTLIEVIVAGLYYNANATVQYLESKQYTAQFFQTWFNEMNHFTRVQDKKLAALGIMSVLTLPSESVPAQLQPNVPRLAQGLVNIMGTLPKAIQDREEMSKAYANDDFYDFDDGDLDAWEDDLDEQENGDQANNNTDDDVEGKAANEYLKFLEESSHKIDGNNFDMDDEELEEEPLLESPLDSINTYIVFRDTFTNLSNTDPTRYQELTSGFTEDENKIVQQTVTLANMTPST